MENFVVTFTDKKRSDGWVLLKNARDLAHAQSFLKSHYQNFSALYKESDFTDGYFPQGCLAEHNLRSWFDYVV